MALYASVTGDAFATLVLILVAAPLAAVALYMGPPEIFALICMAMTIIAGLGTRSLLRGFIAAALGVLIGTVGIEPVSALPRLTFDIVPLERGISLIPVGIGMLAFSEIIIQLEQQLGRKEAREVITFSSKPEDRFITLKEYVECLKTLIRSSIAGTVVGALPGLGAPVASFFAYDQAVKHSKEPETFGQGRLEGIAASESANSAVVASSLIPLFTLGIPGNMAAALLIGGASANKASIFNVVLGTFVFQGLTTMTPTVINSIIHADISEIVRIIVTQGMILYALTRKTEGGKKK